MHLARAGTPESFAAAERMLSFFANGRYGNTQTYAVGRSFNNFSFAPFVTIDPADPEKDAAPLFNFLDHDGEFDTGWVFYNSHGGPTAWMIMAVAEYIEAARAAGRNVDISIYQLINRLGNALLVLQNYNEDGIDTQGGVRFGPDRQFVAPGEINPFYVINAENNLSDLTAFMATHRIFSRSDTPAVYQARASKFQLGADKIVDFLRNAEVYDGEGNRYNGLFDTVFKDSFPLGVYWNTSLSRWTIFEQYATDSAGSWMGLALGPELIDNIAGRSGASADMYFEMRKRVGRTWTFGNSIEGTPIFGVDFSDKFPSNQNEITSEWTAGALAKLRLDIAYYEANPTPKVTSEMMRIMKEDEVAMTLYFQLIRAFRLSPNMEDPMEIFRAYQYINAYSAGPGVDVFRDTGFGWIPPSVYATAMASVSYAFLEEGHPLLRARGDFVPTAVPKLDTVEAKLENDLTNLTVVAKMLAGATQAQAKEKPGELPVMNPHSAIELSALRSFTEQTVRTGEDLVAGAEGADALAAARLQEQINRLGEEIGQYVKTLIRKSTIPEAQEGLYYPIDFTSLFKFQQSPEAGNPEVLTRVNELFPLTAADIQGAISQKGAESLLELIKLSAAQILVNNAELIADPNLSATTLLEQIIGEGRRGETATVSKGALTALFLSSKSDLILRAHQYRAEGKKIEQASAPKPPSVDSKDLATLAAPGGIDFNPAEFNLEIRRDSRGSPLPLPEQSFEIKDIQGFVPVIIRFVPVNLLLLMSELNLDDKSPSDNSNLDATCPDFPPSSDPGKSEQTDPCVRREPLSQEELSLFQHLSTYIRRQFC